MAQVGEAEERYAALASATREGVAIHDGDRIVEINDACCRLFGYSREEAIGRSRLDFVAPELREAASRLQATGHTDPYESIGIRKDGSRFPVEFCGRPILYQGRVMRVALARDLTQQRQAEAAVKDAELRLRLAVEASDLGIWDWNLATGEMVWSERAKSIYGFSPLEPVRFEAVRDATHPDDLPRTHAMALRALDPALREKQPYEFRIRRVSDGELRWMLAHGEAVFAPDGQGGERATRYVGTIQDITERKRIERERRQIARASAEQAARLNAVLSATSSEISMFDTERRYLFASQRVARLLGRRPEEFNGRTMREMGIHPAVADRLDGEMTEAMSFRRTLAGQITEPSGESDRTVDYDIAPVLSADGLLLGTVLSGRDVTERNRTEQALRLALEQRELAGRELSHRVKNTLQMVSALLHLQSTRISDPAVLAEFDKARRRVATIANAHAALYTATMPGGDVGHMDIDRLIETICQGFGELLTLDGRIAIRVNAQPARLPADVAVPLALIVNELVTNALKYAFPDDRQGVVEVEFAPHPEGGYRLVVGDTGRGLPVVEEPGSRGLGLQLVGAFAAQIGATMTVENRSGLHVTIRVP